MLYNKPAELGYGWGYTQIPEIKNDLDLAKIQTQVSNNQAERRAADDELMNANKLAENHPLTNLGIMLGMPLGHIAAHWAAGVIPKIFGKKNNSADQPTTPQQNISPNYLTDPNLAQKQFAQNTGQVATSLMPSVGYQRNPNPYGLKTNYFPYPTSGNPNLDLAVKPTSTGTAGNYNFEVPKVSLNWQPQNVTPSIWNRQEKFF